MKRLILISFILFVGQNFLFSQTNSNQKSSELTFLVDITDEEIFSQIRSDFEQSLPTFFQTTGLGKIKALEKFTLAIAPINATGELRLTSKSISIPRKGMSLQEERKLGNPQPLMSMLKQQLNAFDSIKTAHNEQSYIMDIVLKTIAQANESAGRNVIVVLSDLLEYSPVHNMYKKIPTSNQEIEQLINNIDPIILRQAKIKLQLGCDPEVIVVFKQKAGSRNGRELKRFWTGFLNKIGITTVIFIDNFTQNPQI